jgi:hypothetical protein
VIESVRVDEPFAERRWGDKEAGSAVCVVAVDLRHELVVSRLVRGSSAGEATVARMGVRRVES